MSNRGKQDLCSIITHCLFCSSALAHTFHHFLQWHLRFLLPSSYLLLLLLLLLPPSLHPPFFNISIPPFHFFTVFNCFYHTLSWRSLLLWEVSISFGLVWSCGQTNGGRPYSNWWETALAWWDRALAQGVVCSLWARSEICQCVSGKRLAPSSLQ